MNDEFGDFQTPPILAEQVCKLLADRRFVPSSILEPTCGIGNFLLAAHDQFPEASVGLGLEINADYVARLRASLGSRPYGDRVSVIQGDFFRTDWTTFLRDIPEPILVIGNPPWVTNAHLGTLGGTN